MSTANGRSGGTPLGQLAIPTSVVAACVWVAQSYHQFPAVPILTAAAASCLVLTLNSPGWVVVALLIPELSIFNYQVRELGMTLRLALALGGLALTLKVVLAGLRSADPALRRLLLPAAVFVLVATACNAMFEPGDYVFKYFRYQATQLATLLLVACLIRDRQDLRRAAIAALVLGSLSGLAAIWQHYSPATSFYGEGDAGYIRAWKARSIGLSDNPVILANSMLFVLVPLLGLVVAQVMPRGNRLRLAIAAAIGLTFTGMYFSFTRSGLIGAGGGLAAMVFYLRGRTRNILLATIVVLFLVYQFALTFGFLGARYTKDATNDRSAASHEALLWVGIAMAVDNITFGVGHQRFEELAEEYMHVLEAEEDGSHGAGAVGVERPHNDFLSVVISWGFGALASYVLMLVGAYRNFAVGARNQDPLVRGIAVGAAGGMSAYLVNSAFHNSLDSSSALFLFAGLSVALARMPAGGRRRRERAPGEPRRFAPRPPQRRPLRVVRRRVGPAVLSPLPQA
jgi:hypothetical protein